MRALLVCLLLLQGCGDPAMAREPARAMTASWYSVASLKKEGTWAHSKGMMADGGRFEDSGLTCAGRLWPLGARVRVVNLRTGKAVVVEVTDRIGKRFAGKRVDLSKRAFSEIADLKEGLIKVKMEEL